MHVCACIIHFAHSLYFSMHFKTQKKYYAAHKIEACTLDYAFKPLMYNLTLDICQGHYNTVVNAVVVCLLCW